MKKTLLTVCALTVGLGLSAQTYFSEDFSGGLGQFTATDADGDGFNWDPVDYAAGDGQGTVASSASWDATALILNPDNWLISTPIDLTSATGSINLEWKVYAQDQAWADEEYTVYVGTTGTIAGLTGSATNFNEVVGTSAGYMDRVLDVSSFAGQTIYIGARHHNSSDWFRVNMDDFVVRTLQSDDVEMTSISTATVSATGTNVSIAGTITNKGGNTITSVDLTWDDGTGPYSQTIGGLSIAANGTYNFTHGTQLNVASAIAYNLTVDVQITGVTDGDPSNNSMAHTVSGLAFVPDRHVVIEEGTGTWCGWCPRGAVAMEALSNDATRSKFIGIAVHNGDPMTVAAYDAGADFSGFPGMNVNRKLLGEGVSTAAMQGLYDQEVVEPTNADVGVVATHDWGHLKVDVTATFAATTNTEHRLAAILVEDNVTGTSAGYDQTNYYDGGGSGALSGGGVADWTTAGDPVPAANMTYDHVGRMLIGDYEGSIGTVVLPALAGTSQSKGWVIPFTSADYTNFKVVGLLINSTTGEIMNASETAIAVSVDEESIVNSFNVYPNPATSNTNISFELNEVSDVTISVVNMMGQSVYNESKSNVSDLQRVNLNTNDMASGMYFVNLTINGETVTKKLSISK